MFALTKLVYALSVELGLEKEDKLICLPNIPIWVGDW